MVGLCDDIIVRAIKNRLESPGMRNFTGNLINSIACAIYRDGTLEYATFSSDKVKGAVRMKMTAPRKYNFYPAWDGGEVVDFRPEVKTDEGYGDNAALNFVREYKPSGKSKLEMVLAYTTEYAAFVEMQRHTTGYLSTVEYINIEAKKIKQKLSQNG